MNIGIKIIFFSFINIGIIFASAETKQAVIVVDEKIDIKAQDERDKAIRNTQNLEALALIINGIADLKPSHEIDDFLKIRERFSVAFPQYNSASSQQKKEIEVSCKQIINITRAKNKDAKEKEEAGKKYDQAQSIRFAYKAKLESSPQQAQSSSWLSCLTHCFCSKKKTE